MPVVALAVISLLLFGVFLSQETAEPTRKGDTARSRVLGAGHRLVRFGGEVGLDATLATLAFFTAYLLLFEESARTVWIGDFAAAAPIVVPVQLVLFAALGVYKTLWRFLAVTDVVGICRAVELIMPSVTLKSKPNTKNSRANPVAPNKRTDCPDSEFILNIVRHALRKFAQSAKIHALKYFQVRVSVINPKFRQGSKMIIFVPINTTIMNYEGRR